MAYLWDPLADLQKWWNPPAQPATYANPWSNPAMQPSYSGAVPNTGSVGVAPSPYVNPGQTVSYSYPGGQPATKTMGNVGGMPANQSTSTINPYRTIVPKITDPFFNMPPGEIDFTQGFEQPANIWDALYPKATDIYFENQRRSTTPVDMGGLGTYGEPISAWQAAQEKWDREKFAMQQASDQQQYAQTSAYQQAQLAADQQWRQQQLEADKQARLATLAAQPKSWLEYAALANQPPAVQPWMLPLMPQDYQQTQPVGSAISGWAPENMKGMPDLINPSAQYRARMGPTALQQYYGYQQADQGITPQEQEWRLWSQGPPGGSYQGLRQTR